MPQVKAPKRSHLFLGRMRRWKGGEASGKSTTPVHKCVFYACVWLPSDHKHSVCFIAPNLSILPSLQFSVDRRHKLINSTRHICVTPVVTGKLYLLDKKNWAHKQLITERRMTYCIKALSTDSDHMARIYDLEVISFNRQVLLTQSRQRITLGRHILRQHFAYLFYSPLCILSIPSSRRLRLSAHPHLRCIHYPGWRWFST